MTDFEFIQAALTVIFENPGARVADLFTETDFKRIQRLLNRSK